MGTAYQVQTVGEYQDTGPLQCNQKHPSQRNTRDCVSGIVSRSSEREKRRHPILSGFEGQHNMLLDSDYRYLRNRNSLHVNH